MGMLNRDKFLMLKMTNRFMRLNKTGSSFMAKLNIHGFIRKPKTLCVGPRVQNRHLLKPISVMH